MSLLMGKPVTLDLDDISAFRAYVNQLEEQHLANLAKIWPKEQPQINPHHALARVLREVAAGQLLRSLYEVTEKKRYEDHYGQW